VPGYDAEKDLLRLTQLQLKMAYKHERDQTAVIAFVRNLTLPQRDALNDEFKAQSELDIAGFFAGNISSSKVWTVLCSVAWGPLISDVELLHTTMSDNDADEMFLTEVLLDRPQQELNLLIDTYKLRFENSLVDDVKRSTKGNLGRMFVMALKSQRPPDSAPVDRKQVSADVDKLVKAGKDKEEMPFIEVFVRSSRPHLAAVITACAQKNRSLSKVIKKNFSNGLKNALLYVLHGVKAKRDGQGIWRDAKLLEATMAGFGTRDTTLVYRIVRAHWDRARFERIQAAFESRYGRTLEKRVRGETSGTYRVAMTMLIRDDDGWEDVE